MRLGLKIGPAQQTLVGAIEMLPFNLKVCARVCVCNDSIVSLIRY